MDEDSSPPSPLAGNLPQQDYFDHQRPRSENNRNSSIRTKERRDSTYGGISSRDLAKMLVSEEAESTNLRKMLAMLSNQLRDETQRADDSDRRARDIAVRLKASMEAKFVVEQEASRLHEELRLYKIQLDNAQQEIYKAQEVLNDVESQRVEAENSAARARDTARKLKEQRLVDIAREEGRRLGIKEGLARGQDVGYRQGREAGYAQSRLTETDGATLEEVDDEDDYYDGSTSSAPSRPPTPPKSATPPQSVHSRSTHRSRPPTFVDPPDRDVPVPPPVATPVQMPTPQRSNPSMRVQSPPIVRPVQITRTMPAPAPAPLHSKISIPPDGWIPMVSEEGEIRLPPPHELSPQPSPPGPQITLQEEPPLMMRPPSNSRHASENDSTSSSPPRRPHHMRRRSNDSSASTSISQLDIVSSTPNVRPGHGQARERTLSAISEERSSAAPSPNPSYQTSLNTASPRQRYRSTESLHPPPVIPPPSLRKTNSSSSEEYGIEVVPPSRPTSRTYTPETNPLSAGLLSADDANNRPPPSPKQEETPLTPIIDQLPPGFVPFTPGGSSIGGSSIGPAGVPLPPSTVGTVRTQLAPTPGYSFHNIPGGHVVEEPDTEPVIPSRSRKYSSAKSASTTASGRNRKAPSSTDSDDEVSSSLGSSADSLTTPAKKAAPLPLYGGTPIIDGMSLAGQSGRTAARVPLPPSTVAGTPKSTRSGTTAASRGRRR